MSRDYQGQIVLEQTDNKTTMKSASVWEKLKKIAMAFVSAGVITLIGFVIGSLIGWDWLVYTAYVIGGLILIMMLVQSFKSQVANCPYCDEELGKGSYDYISKDDENFQISCTNCLEHLISHQGEVRAFKTSDITNEKKFEAPALEGGKWPNECITCGSPAISHYGQASKTKFNAGQLLVGRLSVSSGSVSNIPYCENHGDDIGLKIEDDELRLVFPDFYMMRRYVSVNKKKGLKILENK